MAEISGFKGPGMVPHLSEDQIKQNKYSEIKAEAGKAAFVKLDTSKQGKPRIRKGVYDARGALKFVEQILKEGEQKNEK